MPATPSRRCVPLTSQPVTTEPTPTPRSDLPSNDLRSRVQSLRIPEDQKQSGGRGGLWLLILLLLGTNGYTGYRWYQLQGAPKKSDAAEPVGAVSAANNPTDTGASGTSAAGGPASEPVDSPKSQISLESRGYITPAKQILVSPKVSGTLVMLNIEEGKRVTKGEILAEIEQTEYKAELDRQLALLAGAKQRLLELETGSRPEEVSQAEAELSEAQNELAEAERQYKRQVQLSNQSAGANTNLTQAETNYQSQQRKVERAKLALDLMKKGPRVERVEAARAEVRQVQADLDRAQWRIGNCTIRAPISGTILRKNSEEGNIVNPVAFNGSYSVCEMADLSNLEIELKILEADIKKVRVGQRCVVTADAWPDRKYEGRVDRLMPIADRAQGAIPTRVKVRVPADEEGVYLKPEMSAVVTFLNEDAPPAP